APMYLRPYHDLMVFLSKHRWLWETLMSGGVVFTMAVEIGVPFLIWSRRLRWACVLCAVLLHTMIGVFMGLVSFSLFMLVMVLSFVPPEVVRQAVDRLLAQARQAIRPTAEHAPALTRA